MVEDETVVDVSNSDDFINILYNDMQRRTESTFESTVSVLTYTYGTRFVLPATQMTRRLTTLQIIVAAAQERFNPQASVVLEAAIKATEQTQLTLSDARTGTKGSILIPQSSAHIRFRPHLRVKRHDAVGRCR